MRRLALLLLVALTSCSATLQWRATVPSVVNLGTCDEPLLLPSRDTSLKTLVFEWYGPRAGRRLFLLAPGDTARISEDVPAGIYTVRCWVENVGGPNCVETATDTLGAVPARPALRKG